MEKFLEQAALFLAQNPVVLHKIKEELDCDTEFAKEAFMETAKFLEISKDNTFTVPSLIVDDAWHAFIICTKEYQKFCQDFLGTFIHHSPELPTENPSTTNEYSDGYQKTLSLLSEKGKVNKKFWKVQDTEAKCGGSGCSSDTPQVVEAKCGGSGCSSDNPQVVEAKCGGSGCSSDNPQLTEAKCGGSGCSSDEKAA